ncbi:hypothetical protein PVAND_003033 [Polypedilum vanderplanki]|uniref:Enoyl-CoA hydratase n=1 Tax=Polypedilum vanderplanki TaxID=319348 RepID=A0A9J6BT87_POLVA|nr:hypothetical protein PVAND_003033 [Polypedilum vanderplanki]
MLQSVKFTNLIKTTGLRALTGFITPGRSYCASKDTEKQPVEEKEQNESKETEAPIEPEPLIKVEKNGPVTLIGINRPDVRNCINTEAASELSAAIEFYENDLESPIGILYGIGGNFCSGYDLKELTADPGSISNILMRSEGAMGPTRRMIKKPLIAAVNGYCVAGGFELALMCDLRVMEVDAVMGFFNRRFGVPLVDGGTVRLAPMIGLSRALDLVLTGRQISSKEALEIGLANRVVATGTALGQALNLAQAIAKFPQACAHHDRESLYNTVYNSNNKDEALDFELMSCGTSVLEEAKQGAEKFIKEKIGRHGSFADLKPKEIPEWETEEIKIEKSHKKDAKDD